MAFDEELAERVRAALAPTPGITELRMFGGLCFTLGGNMGVGIVGDDLMVRLGPEEGEAALVEPHVREMDFTGRPMRGFVFVGPAAELTEAELGSWVQRGIDYASSLPPKKPKKAKARKPPRSTGA